MMIKLMLSVLIIFLSLISLSNCLSEYPPSTYDLNTNQWISSSDALSTPVSDITNVNYDSRSSANENVNNILNQDSTIQLLQHHADIDVENHVYSQEPNTTWRENCWQVRCVIPTSCEPGQGVYHVRGHCCPKCIRRLAVRPQIPSRPIISAIQPQQQQQVQVQHAGLAVGDESVSDYPRGGGLEYCSYHCRHCFWGILHPTWGGSYRCCERCLHRRFPRDEWGRRGEGERGFGRSAGLAVNLDEDDLPMLNATDIQNANETPNIDSTSTQTIQQSESSNIPESESEEQSDQESEPESETSSSDEAGMNIMDEDSPEICVRSHCRFLRCRRGWELREERGRCCPRCFPRREF